MDDIKDLQQALLDSRAEVAMLKEASRVDGDHFDAERESWSIDKMRQIQALQRELAACKASMGQENLDKMNQIRDLKRELSDTRAKLEAIQVEEKNLIAIVAAVAESLGVDVDDVLSR